MALAAKIPFRHPYAAGFPGLGSQAVPTDADALDYLDRMAAADGASVEVGVATAVDAFVRDLKADSLWDAIGSSCLLCGPRTLAGALVPLRGDAPTAYGGWASGDYDRSTGMKGNGSSLYLDSNYGPENLNATDLHLSVCVTELNDAYTSSRFISQDNNSLTILGSAGATGFRSRVVSSNIYTLGSGATVPSLLAVSRASGDSFSWFGYGQSGSQNDAGGSINAAAGNPLIFKGSAGFSNYLASRLAFYSIGTSIDLAKLDSHVSAYVTAIGAAV